MIAAAELARMKPTALVINTSRGGLIDEAALAAALDEGRIGGAGIDTFDEEPPRPDNPLFASDRAILSPHIAGLTKEAMARLSIAAAENVLAGLDGRLDPALVVNAAVLGRGTLALAVPSVPSCRRKPASITAGSACLSARLRRSRWTPAFAGVTDRLVPVAPDSQHKDKNGKRMKRLRDWPRRQRLHGAQPRPRLPDRAGRVRPADDAGAGAARRRQRRGRGEGRGRARLRPLDRRLARAGRRPRGRPRRHHHAQHAPPADRAGRDRRRQAGLLREAAGAERARRQARWSTPPSRRACRPWSASTT